jgi:hypothetical protein
MGAEFGRDVTQIALTLTGVALVALLVSNARGVSEIVSTTGKTFGGLLGIVTLQSNYQNLFSN